MYRISLLLLALWTVCGHGQDLLYSLAGGVGNSGLTSNCGSTFQSANATGFFQVQPNVALPNSNSGHTTPVELGITVATGSKNFSNAIQWSIWYNTGGANYSNDFELGYDVCAFTIGVIATNTLLRGQTDSGNCVATFGTDCVSALESAASGYALGLITNGTPPPGGNLTADSLDRVCYDIANTLQSEFPSECKKYMNNTQSYTVGGFPLTGKTDSVLYNGCDLTNTDNDKSYHLLYTLNAELPGGKAANRDTYSYFNWEVLPSMLTFMPVANYEAPFTIGTASSKMGCLHVTGVNPGSEKPIAAPTPTPLGSGGLSGGTIAGIVVGVVVGVALIAGAAFWFWRRQKAQRKQTSAEAADGEQPPAYGDAKEQTPIAEAAADTGVKELSPDTETRPELATHKSGPKVELAGDSIQKPELKRGNTNDPAELMAELPDSAGPTEGR